MPGKMQIYHCPIIGNGADVPDLMHPKDFPENYGPWRPSVYTTAGGLGRVQGSYNYATMSCFAFVDLDNADDGVLDEVEKDHRVDPLLPERATDHDHKRLLLRKRLGENGMSWRTKTLQRFENNGIPVHDITDNHRIDQLLYRGIRIGFIGRAIFKKRGELGMQFLVSPMDARMRNIPPQAFQAIQDLAMRVKAPPIVVGENTTKRDILMSMLTTYDEIRGYGYKQKVTFAGEVFRG
jgi:hypothetical protein